MSERKIVDCSVTGLNRDVQVRLDVPDQIFNFKLNLRKLHPVIVRFHAGAFDEDLVAIRCLSLIKDLHCVALVVSVNIEFLDRLAGRLETAGALI